MDVGAMLVGGTRLLRVVGSSLSGLLLLPWWLLPVQVPISGGWRHAGWWPLFGMWPQVVGGRHAAGRCQYFGQHLGVVQLSHEHFPWLWSVGEFGQKSVFLVVSRWRY